LATTVVSGGGAAAGVDFGAVRLLQLPPIRAADQLFSGLVDGDGTPIDDGYRERRRRLLLEAFAAVRPRVLVVELFPFGRWQFRFELVPLLDAAATARPRPKIVSSVRDVLVHKPRPARNREMVRLARERFDLVLVHGDPDVVRLERSFPEAAEVGDLLRYTGYVADAREPAAGSDAGAGEVIVSAGGGAVGESLLRTALGAKPLGRLRGTPWRLLVGANTPPRLIDELRSQAPAGAIVEPARPDFPTLLRNCRLSISQAGYNTLLDVVGARARAIVVPFAAAGETEQALRASLFEARGLVRWLSEDALTPACLAEAADRMADSPRPPAARIDMDGARASARIIGAMATDP
jgi:predicted glycosyltransferase